MESRERRRASRHLRRAQELLNPQGFGFGPMRDNRRRNRALHTVSPKRRIFHYAKSFVNHIRTRINKHSEIKFEIGGLIEINDRECIRATIINITRFENGMPYYYGMSYYESPLIGSDVLIFPKAHDKYDTHIVTIIDASYHEFINTENCHAGHVLQQENWFISESFETLRDEVAQKQLEETHEMYKPPDPNDPKSKGGEGYEELVEKYKHGMDQVFEWIQENDDMTSRDALELHKKKDLLQYQKQHAEDQLDKHKIAHLVHEKSGPDTSICFHVY